MNIQDLTLPAGLKQYLLETGNRNEKLTEYVIKKIEEVYLIHKSYHEFNDLKFTTIAIECAERAKEEKTFGSHLIKTLEKELTFKSLHPVEIFHKFNSMPEPLKAATFGEVQLDDAGRFKSIKRLKDLSEGKSNKGVFMHGPFGTGKSYLAAILVNHYLEQGRTALFIHAPGMDLTPELVEYMESVELLVLDDIGFSRKDLDYIMPLLNARLGKLTLFTTNYDLKGLEIAYQDFSRSPIAAAKILELIREHAEPVEVAGKNRRWMS